MTFNSSPNDKILDRTKLRVFADDKINLAKMIILATFILKTLWEKEKMLVASIFFFSQNVFKIHLPQGLQKSRLCGERLKKHGVQI